jgi:hypothetical protein
MMMGYGKGGDGAAAGASSAGCPSPYEAVQEIVTRILPRKMDA